MEPAPKTTQSSSTFRFSSSPSTENQYARRFENIHGGSGYLGRSVNPEQPQSYLGKTTIRQSHEPPSRSYPLDHFEAACSQLRRAWTALAPLSHLDDLSYTFGSLFELLEPKKRFEVLSVLSSKALANLEPEDIPQALQRTFNEMNCQISDPRYHAVFKSPLPPLNEWNELFNRMENDPKVQEAKKTKESGLKGMIKDNPFTERVMDKMRKDLKGSTYDKIRENLDDLKGDNPLVKLIKAIRMTGEVSPCMLLNAVNDAGYTKYIVNFENLLDQPIQSQKGGFDIEPRTAYRSRENDFSAPVTRKDSDYIQQQAQPSPNHSRQPKIRPMSCNITGSQNPGDRHGTVLHEMKTELNKPHPTTFTRGSNMAPSYSAANRTDAGNSLESSKQQTTALYYATTDVVGISKNQYSAHHQEEAMNIRPKKKTAEEASPSPNQMNTLTSGRTSARAGKSNKGHPPQSQRESVIIKNSNTSRSGYDMYERAQETPAMKSFSKP